MTSGTRPNQPRRRRGLMIVPQERQPRTRLYRLARFLLRIGGKLFDVEQRAVCVDATYRSHTIPVVHETLRHRYTFEDRRVAAAGSMTTDGENSVASVRELHAQDGKATDRSVGERRERTFLIPPYESRDYVSAGSAWCYRTGGESRPR